jgi:hypothetical protein
MIKSIILLIIILSILISSCKEQTINNYYYSSIPGSIEGQVTCVTDLGKYSTDNGNINVWIPGTNFKELSDSDGYWKLDSVPAGVYDVYFYKQNCDTTINYAFQFTGNGNAWYGTNIIFEIPTVNIILDSTSMYYISDTMIGVNIYGRCDQKTYFTPFIDSSENVSKYHYISYGISGDPQNSFIKCVISFSLSSGFKSGQIFYVTGYSGRAHLQNDPRIHSKNHFIGFGKQSNVLSITIE